MTATKYEKGGKRVNIFNQGDIKGNMGESFRRALLNVEYNGSTGAIKNYETTLKAFVKKYGNADHEYGISVDDRGYVYRNVEGGAHAVRIEHIKGQTVIHNHPSGGNFSYKDLESTARGDIKAIVAVGKKIYTFTKGSHFKKDDFIEGLRNAKSGANYDYNTQLDNWLKANQGKYGYKYTAENR